MTRPSFPQQALGLLGWLLGVFAAGALGAVASVRATSFYAFLERPTWAPPAWVFGPVWTVLYLLMAIAAWLVWRERGFRGATGALTLFIAQLAANALWTWIFFAWQRGGLALLESALLWLLVAATMVAFWRWHRLAALLLLPYLVWVGFATALTHALWQMNPGQLG